MLANLENIDMAITTFIFSIAFGPQNSRPAGIDCGQPHTFPQLIIYINDNSIGGHEEFSVHHFRKVVFMENDASGINISNSCLKI